jgi:thiamine-monophosphate kinase
MLIGDSYFLVTTDVVFGRTHVPEPMTPFQAGWYVAAVNFSDIAAMGGKPLGLLMALGLPRDMEYEDLEQCILGAQTCCGEYGTEIIGGDTKESEEFTIAGTAVGSVPKDGILLRKGSQTGDQLCVTGPLGRAACGYFALKRGLNLEDAISALMTPRPRISEGMTLASTGAVTACMDISDGLASSLHQMTEHGGSHFRVAYEEVPKSQDTTAFPDIPQEDLVLYFGGDYELVFTVQRDSLWDVQKALDRIGAKLWRIGEVTDSGENTITRGQEEHPLPNRGWEHLSPATLKQFKYRPSVS